MEVWWKYDRSGYLILTQSLSSKLAKTKVQGVYVQLPQNSRDVDAFHPKEKLLDMLGYNKTQKHITVLFLSFLFSIML